MSRIYDALRRASLERKAGQQTEETEAAEEAFVLPGDEELPPVKAEVIIEEIAEQPWNPLMAFLPTLDERGESIEQFRSLRSQIYELCNQAPLKTILISSGMPAEGKTFVAANLAMSLARNSENSILLIDADLRGPSIHAILGAPNKPGLAEYLAGKPPQFTDGLGSTISIATTNGDYNGLAAAVVFMSVVVVAINNTLWRRLQRLAQGRYSLSK